MDELETYRRRRANRWKALRRLGVRNIQCVCGETDPECFDVEHIYRSLFDGTVWGMCANCHRKKSARERSEHPTVGLHPGDPFERMGHRRLGMSVYLDFCADALRTDAEFMFKLAGKGIVIED